MESCIALLHSNPNGPAITPSLLIHFVLVGLMIQHPVASYATYQEGKAIQDGGELSTLNPPCHEAPLPVQPPPFPRRCFFSTRRASDVRVTTLGYRSSGQPTLHRPRTWLLQGARRLHWMTTLETAPPGGGECSVCCSPPPSSFFPPPSPPLLFRKRAPALHVWKGEISLYQLG